MFNTALDILSGFSSTSLYVFADPIAETIPSPTLAITVSSVAPPTSCSIFVRTVTRALALISIPSFATAETFASFGQSITFG